MSNNRKIKNPIIIFASARDEGYTSQAVMNVIKQLPVDPPVINLNQQYIEPFSYSHHQTDDFFEIIQQVLQYDLIILASPVYWYNVCATMKTFIDRLSDLLVINKPLGRKLRGKYLTTIASYSNHPEGYDGYKTPIFNTAKYLGMHFIDGYYHYSGLSAQGIQASDLSLFDFIKSIHLPVL